MTSLSHPIVFYGRWQAGCRGRIKQSPLSQSLSYQNTAGWEPEARKSNITTSPMSHSLVPCSLLLRASMHTMNTYVKTQHTNTLPQLQQSYRNRAAGFAYWWLPAGEKGTDRCSSPIKCQTWSNSRRKLKAAEDILAFWFWFLFTQNFLWVTQIFFSNFGQTQKGWWKLANTVNRLIALQRAQSVIHFPI